MKRSRPADPGYGPPMTEKKKAESLAMAGATQKISKDDLANLIKRAEEEDPEADDNSPLPAKSATAKADSKPPAKKG